jgi:hypothetical protein
MSAVRNLPSIPAVLFAALAALATLAPLGLAGCYDLSAPSGPHRDDFVQNRSGAEPQEQDQTQRAIRIDAGTEATAVDDRAALLDALDRDLEAAAIADERISQTPTVTPDTIR